MNLGLAGQAVIVTGAGRGIGAAIARAFAAEDAAVALVDLAAIGGAETEADGIRALGGRAVAIEADVSRFDAAERAVASAVEALGRVDALVCNAGIVRDRVSWKMSEAEWDDVLTVNLKGTFACCRAVAPRLRAQGSGHIVMVGSINGLRGKFGQSNYAASKAGMVGLTRTLAHELGPSGVTVNCVAPGMVRTAMTAALPADRIAAAEAETVLGHIAEPEDVANAVVFLCSSLARHITGEVLRVDGGQCL